MFTRTIALGLRDWHAFWTPVKAWAEYHQEHNGNALVFFASVVTIIGLPILSLLIVATLGFLISDRIDAKRLRGLQRSAILLGLKTELKGTRDMAGQALAAYAPGSARGWTILPTTGVEQALIEAGLLDLTAEQIVGLHQLQARILTANSLGPSREIQDQFEVIAGLCDNLLARLQAV
jgi:hypothetical protein